MLLVILKNWQHAEACPGACSREFGWDVGRLLLRKQIGHVGRAS